MINTITKTCLVYVILAVSVSVTFALDLDTKTQGIRGGNVITGFTGVVEFTANGSGCTANMISSNVLLTAAHCLVQNNALSGSTTFNIFYHDPGIGRRQVYNGMGNWIAHRDYDFNQEFSPGKANADIAVVTVNGVFNATTYEDYLRLYAGPKDTIKTRLSAYGAGLYTYSGKDDNNLRENWFNVEHVKNNHIVIDTRKYDGICEGDSGGPLIYEIPGEPTIPTITGVSSTSEQFIHSEIVCSNNDWGVDDVFYSRTNWSKLESLMLAANISCELLTVNNINYRRCFKLPYIESVPYEGEDRGVATAVVITTLPR